MLGSNTSPKISLRTPVYEGKWLRFVELTCHHNDHTYTWEAVERTTTSNLSYAGSVEIIPIIHYNSKESEIVLVRQWRPAINAYVVEWPAGLLDQGEDVETAAIRELREETGYTASVVHTTPVFASGPSISASRGKLVIMKIDGNDTNSLGNQQLEETECLSVLTLPLSNLYDELEKLGKDGQLVEARLLSFSYGLNFNSFLK
ncbi:hypothetical protein P9112_008844 [Eukaryota sp. TZLM1-RC]